MQFVLHKMRRAQLCRSSSPAVNKPTSLENFKHDPCHVDPNHFSTAHTVSLTLLFPFPLKKYANTHIKSSHAIHSPFDFTFCIRSIFIYFDFCSHVYILYLIYILYLTLYVFFFQNSTVMCLQASSFSSHCFAVFNVLCHYMQKYICSEFKKQAMVAGVFVDAIGRHLVPLSDMHLDVMTIWHIGLISE